jgi:cellulose synthase/poly-beta-1,6-N-acetylglucosamine synthase-like glycosyltransferase
VTIVIAAHNEERAIGETLRNKLALEYPRDRLDIVVVSDGSTDRTDEIVRGFASEGVRGIRQEPRQGKTAALNRAVAEARGEVIVFSDANSLYHRDAVRHLAANFTDPTVGYVTGRLSYLHDHGSAVGGGCSSYMRYEDALRRAESRLGSLVGVNGGIDAVRASVYRRMPPDEMPDLALPLLVIEQGYRVVYEPDALLHEEALTDARGEYRMRVRVALRALSTLAVHRRLLNPMRSGVYAVQLWSHKVLRYVAFIPFAGLLAANFALAPHGRFFLAALIAQSAGYAGALLGWRLDRRGRRSRLASTLFYFSLVNVAAAHACWKWLWGERRVVWNPRGG